MEKYIWFELIGMLLTIGVFILVVFSWIRWGSMRDLPIVLIVGVATFFVCYAVKPTEQTKDEDEHE